MPSRTVKLVGMTSVGGRKDRKRAEVGASSFEPVVVDEPVVLDAPAAEVVQPVAEEPEPPKKAPLRRGRKTAAKSSSADSSQSSFEADPVLDSGAVKAVEESRATKPARKSRARKSVKEVSDA